MTTTRIDESSGHQPLRLWPGVVIVALQWLARFGVVIFEPDAAAYGAMAGLLGGPALLVWWAFFSRAPAVERWGGVILMIVTPLAVSKVLHESIATGGMGFLFYIYLMPVLNLAFVVWAVSCRHLAARPRRLAMVATILLACLVWTLVRTGGITGSFDSDFAWRWTETPEERLLAQGGNEQTAFPSDPMAADTGTDWPGFRGTDRDGIVHGVRIKTDWSGSPPVELWRRPVGPGWSSFAVHGGVFYTQEQRGDDEVVTCYSMTTGRPVWQHRDALRFWESNAGAGPRATPTLSNDHVYTLGATGLLNVLDAEDGTAVWSRDAAADTNVQVPTWGFASSPLVFDDAVIVAAAGTLIAYDRFTGEPLWFGPDGGAGYSSPHLMTIDGVSQILLLSGAGAASLAPADGKPLWNHSWPGGTGIVQPALIEEGDILIGGAEGAGIRRIAVAPGADGWTVNERWTSTGLKPPFNDFVVHAGHAFGFDGSILACIDIEDGKRQWKGGRYGNGQLILLADQDLLLVLSERGELALVEATPDQFSELARFPAIQSKTWNHPVLIDDVLLVRNSQEMAAFRLSLEGHGR
jgi:outer membrane protein assembly factor BamB